jgi:secreted Zn-dependent insulinase-like peptidase
VKINHTRSPRISIRLRGYSSRVAVRKLLKEIYEAIRAPKFSDSRLQSDVDEFIKTLSNWDYEELFKQTRFALDRWMFNSSIVNSPKLIIQAARDYKTQSNWRNIAEVDIRQVISEVFASESGYHNFILLEGNIQTEDLDQIESVRTGTLPPPSLPRTPPQLSVFRNSFIRASAAPILYHRALPTIPVGRSAVRLIVQIGGTDDPIATAFAALLHSIVSQQFFTALRTQQQLGYAVTSAQSTVRDRHYHSFTVQTEKLNGTATLGRMQDWIQTWIIQGLADNDEYCEMNGKNETLTPFAEHFERSKASVIADWKAKHPSLGVKTDEHEELLLWNIHNLDIRDHTLQSLRDMTRDQFRYLIRQYLGATESWRAVVLDGSAGVQFPETTRKVGWSVVTDHDLDSEDSDTASAPH